jgi:hypothetical protein
MPCAKSTSSIMPKPEVAALAEVLRTLRAHPMVTWCERMNPGAARIAGICCLAMGSSEICSEIFCSPRPACTSPLASENSDFSPVFSSDLFGFIFLRIAASLTPNSFAKEFSSVAGDLAAVRLLLERSIAPLRPTKQVVTIGMAHDSGPDQARAVLAAVSAGKLASKRAAQLIGALAARGMGCQAEAIVSKSQRVGAARHAAA